MIGIKRFIEIEIECEDDEDFQLQLLNIMEKIKEGYYCGGEKFSDYSRYMFDVKTTGSDDVSDF